MFYYLNYSIQEPIEPDTNTQNQHIIGFIEGCVDQKAKQSLFYLGFIGGDTKIKKLSTNEYEFPFKEYYEYDEYYKIPYHFHNNIPIIESVQIKQILEEFMNQNFKYCIKNFDNFQQQAVFDFESEPETDVLIKDKEVIFNVNFPVKVEKTGQKEILGPVFTTKIPLRLKKIDEINRHIIDEAKKDSSIIHWPYLKQITEQDFNITAYPGKQNTILYRIIDEKYKIDNNEFVYQFAVKVK